MHRFSALENILLYFSLNDGSILDYKTLCENIEIKRRTAENLVNILECIGLIRKIEPYGYGKDILRGKYKIYLGDPSCAPALFMRGLEILEDPTLYGKIVESIIAKHLHQYSVSNITPINYYQNKKNQEIDFILTIGYKKIPIEVKQRSTHTDTRDAACLVEFIREKQNEYGYLITKNCNDFGKLDELPIMKIPAYIFCYWMGEHEGEQFSL